MLKRKVFEETGGFDENIFMYLEEVEWCKRIKDEGCKVWYTPQFDVVHLHGASSKSNLQSMYIQELKGIKYYLKKHYSPAFYLVKPFLILGTVLRVITFSLLGKTLRARAYMEGLKVI